MFDYYTTNLNNYQIALVLIVIPIASIFTGYWLYLKHKVNKAKKLHWKNKYK